LVDYVEKATLQLVDQTSGKVNKINAALRSLRKEATATQKALAGLGKGASPANLNKTAAALNNIAKASKKIPKRITTNIEVKGAKSSDIKKMADALGQFKKANKGLTGLLGSQGKTPNFAGLDTLVSKLVRVARAANLAQMALAKVKNNIPTNAGQGGGRGGGRTRNPGQSLNPPTPRNIGLSIQPLKSFLRSWLVDMGHTIVNSIKQGFAEGIKGFDVASNKFQQQRFTPEQQAELAARARTNSQANPLIRYDQRMDLYAEVASNFKDPLDATRLDPSLDRAVKVSVQQGQSAAEAITGVATFIRGLGQAGYLQDSKGNFDPNVIKYIDAFTSAKVSEGAQINFNDAFQLLKNSKTSGQSLTPEGFFMQLLAAADVGASTQGVQLNMATKTFAGETTKKAIQAQEDAGLREKGRLVKSGAVGKKTTYSYEAGALKDEELFRENPADWIRKYILGKGGFLDQKGVNGSNAAAVISALDPLSGNRNSDDFLAKAVLQFQEALIKNEKYFQNPITDKELNNIDLTSSWVQLQETTNQLVGLFGLLGDKLEGLFIPVIDKIGAAADYLTGIIDGRSKGQMQDYALLGAATAGAGVVGYGATKGLQALWGFGLPAAASSLQLAATMLQGAATKLGFGSAAGTVAAGGGAAAAATTAGGAAAVGWSTVLRYAGLGFLASQTLGLGSVRHDPAVAKMFEEQQKYYREQNAAKEANRRDPNSLSGRIDAQIADQAMRDRKDADQSVINLQSSFQDGATQLQSAFETGTGTLVGGAVQFGSEAGASILGVASQFGSAAGAAMRAAIGQLNLNVNGPAAAPAAPNTGTNTNIQSGG
jgi:hypothetical protein